MGDLRSTRNRKRKKNSPPHPRWVRGYKYREELYQKHDVFFEAPVQRGNALLHLFQIFPIDSRWVGGQILFEL